ncbi:MAG: hypothetical protein M3471_05650, partial [Actinomycetota bacterium]|nr:hypothetical protein [Actinomycetota bacterium]
MDWRPGGRQPSQKKRVVLIAAVLAVLGGVVVVALSGGDEVDDTDISAAAGRWTPMSDGPLSPRIAAANVWTGQELLLWGGRDCPAGRCDDESVPALVDGAAYDPATDTWRILAPSPLSPRSGTSAQWTGTEMLVWGGRDADGPLTDGAAFDPVGETWRA